MTDAQEAPVTLRERLVTKAAHGLAMAAGAGLLVIFAINVGQIFARPIFGGWIWVNDLSRLLIAWVIMLGAGAAYGLREHLLVDLLAEKLRGVGEIIVALILRVIEVVVGLLLLLSGAVVALSRMSIRYIQLGVPTGWAFMAIPALGLAMLVFGLCLPLRASSSAQDEEAANA